MANVCVLMALELMESTYHSSIKTREVVYVFIEKGVVVADGSLTSMRDTRIELRVNSLQILKGLAEAVTLVVTVAHEEGE